MIFAGMALVFAGHSDNAPRNSWKDVLGLTLAANPILFYISYLYLSPNSYTAF
jgi:hypothetical protein